MPLESSEPKGRFWEDTSLPVISGLTPGVYTVPQITVDEYGRITSAVSGAGAGAIGAQNAGTPIAGGPFNILNLVGGNIVGANGGAGVLDLTVSSTGSINALDEGVAIPGGPFTSINLAGANIAGTDGGGGQLDVTVFGGTNTFEWVKSAAGITASQNIGTPIDPTSIINKITVVVTGAYDPGATLQVEDGLANVLMTSALINPQVVGTYELQIPGNLTAIADPQIVLIVGGAPAAGSCVVEVVYQVP